MSSIENIIELSLTWGRIMRRNMMRLNSSGKLNFLQMHALWVLAERKTMTMKELADGMMIKAPTATTFADRLVKSGFVRRFHDAKNRKRVHLTLTTSGRKMVLRSQRAQRQMMRKILGVLPAKDQRAMARILKLLVTAHSHPPHA